MVIFSRKLAYTSVDAYAQTSSHTRGLVEPVSTTPLQDRGMTVLIPAISTLVSAVSLLRPVPVDSPQLLRSAIVRPKSQRREKNVCIKLKNRKHIRPPEAKYYRTYTCDQEKYVSSERKTKGCSRTYKCAPDGNICNCHEK